MSKRSDIITVCVGLAFASSATVASADTKFVPRVERPNTRCLPHSEEQVARMEAVGIVEICVPLTVRNDDSWHRIVTDIVAGVAAIFQPIIGHIPLHQPDAATIRFEIKGSLIYIRPDEDDIDKTPPSDFMDDGESLIKIQNYVLCDWHERSISDIPGVGKYLRHGFKNLTDTSIEYSWHVARRRYHNVRFNSDVYAYFVPSEKLESARAEGLCRKEADWKVDPWYVDLNLDYEILP